MVEERAEHGVAAEREAVGGFGDFFAVGEDGDEVFEGIDGAFAVCVGGVRACGAFEVDDGGLEGGIVGEVVLRVVGGEREEFVAGFGWAAVFLEEACEAVGGFGGAVGGAGVAEGGLHHAHDFLAGEALEVTFFGEAAFDAFEGGEEEGGDAELVGDGGGEATGVGVFLDDELPCLPCGDELVAAFVEAADFVVGEACLWGAGALAAKGFEFGECFIGVAAGGCGEALVEETLGGGGVVDEGRALARAEGEDASGGWCGEGEGRSGEGEGEPEVSWH